MNQELNVQPRTTPERVIVGISGASGAIYGVRLLKALQALEVETHLVVSPPGEATLQHEVDVTPDALERLSSRRHAFGNIGAPIASGSFQTAGMVIAPCSIKTLSAIANSHTDNLLVRAADVTLKEGRRLILMVRETPLHLGHLRLMVRAAEIGAVIFPPMPAFYAHPETIDDLVNQTVGRVMARLGFDNRLYDVWTGL